MNRIELKKVRRDRRKTRVRKRVFGTPDCPRLTVFRSLQHIYAQVVDDTTGHTLVAVSSRGKDVQPNLPATGNVKAAEVVGKALGERAMAAGIKQVVFDRNGYRFHGRVAALAKGLREAGVKV